MDRQAERLGGLEINDQLERGRLHHRQISGFGPLEDLPGVNTDLPIDPRETRPIADQAAVRGVFTKLIYRRNGMACWRREAANRTSDVAGDGTTTATVLAQAIVRESIKSVAAGMNPMEETAARAHGSAAQPISVRNSLCTNDRHSSKRIALSSEPKVREA